jgi:hypothetical protein
MKMPANMGLKLTAPPVEASGDTLPTDTDMTRGLRRTPKPHVRLLIRGIPRLLRALQRHERIHQ